MGVATLLHRAGFHKRSGLDAMQIVYLLLFWIWLKVDTYQYLFSAIHAVFYRFQPFSDLKFVLSAAEAISDCYPSAP